MEKTFHIEPPEADATPEEWEQWLKRETRAEGVAKAQRTKAMAHADLSDLPHFVPGSCVTSGDGVHRQQFVAMGFSGDFESGNGVLELIAPATQARYFQARGSRAIRPKAVLLNARRKVRSDSNRAKRFKQL